MQYFRIGDQAGEYADMDVLKAVLGNIVGAYHRESAPSPAGEERPILALGHGDSDLGALAGR